MAEHNFQIKSDSPAAGDMMFWTIVGHETLSRPSFYELRVLSKVDKMAATDVLGHAFDVVIEFEDADGGKHERHCQGHAVRFVRAGAVGRYFEYRISLRSLFWLLGKRVNSRILQDKSALEVLDAVYEDSPIKRFKKTKTDKVIGKHPKRTYVVQYQESDYHYLSRLLEDEGIYYWFDAHEEPGTMHLADISDVAHEKLPAADTLSYSRRMGSDVRFNEITRWLDARRLNSGKFASRDSDFKAITQKLAGDKADPDTHELADLEVFEFPGGYFKKDSTDERAKVRMEELASRRNLHWALTPWPDVAVGRTFTFKGDPLGERDADYLIAGCSFVVTHPGYEGTDAKDGNVQRLGGELLEMLADHSMGDDWLGVARDVAESTPDLRLPRPGVCTFLLTTLPVEHLYRPPRTTPRVTMPGPQSAIVVGPKGEEIYADDQGRVKVHFHWDRYDGSDEKSTCWVRVSQPWAGKGWGGYFIPRIGQEVIVDFLNGDPDRPIIVGRVYNDEQTIPFSSHTQSGFRTRSTPKGNASNCNEFRFEDKKGSEQVFLHAEKNQDIEVENDETHWVGHDRKKTIDHDETNHIKNNRTETVDVDETITVHGKRTESVDGTENITIGASRIESVGASESVTIGASRSHTIGAGETLDVAASQTITVGASRTDTVGAAMTQTIGAGLTQTVGGAWNMTAAGPVTITAPAGLTIVAPGGTNIVDFQLCQVGGTIKEGYASKLDFNILAMEANAAKIEATGSSNALIGAKFERVGADILSKGLSIAQMDALAALSCATNIEMETLKLIL